MQPLNHDMDELMRQAAADYPVKPHGADWDKVAQQLDAAEPGKKGGGHGHLKKLLFLLPFVLASFVCDRYLYVSYGGLKKWGAIESVESSKNSSAEPATQSDRRPETTGSQAIRTAAYPMNGTPIEKPAVISKARIVSKNDFSVRIDAPFGFSETQPASNNMDVLKSNSIDLFSLHHVATAATATTIPDKIAAQAKRITITEPYKKTGKKKAPPVQLDKGYVTLLMGPDISRVKSERTNPAGYTIGLLGGVRLYKRLALEAGVLWDKKNYYSSGEYFKTDKINLPQHSKVLSVDGYCAMFELPVNLRFNAITKPRHTLFVSGGVSSYLMHKEDYSYVYRRYDVDYAGTTMYKKASKDWGSVGNVSIGYEYKLGSQLKLHIEPYLRVPLKGVGIGSLPLHSTGLLVGITHPFH